MSTPTNVKEGASGADIPVATFIDADGNKVQYVLTLGAIAPVEIITGADDAADQVAAPDQPLRRMMVLTNTDSVRVYLRWGNPASTLQWNFFIEPGERWEMGYPFLGELHARWAPGAGTPAAGFEDVGAYLQGYEGLLA